jgi:hypothetical protein
MSGTKTCPSCNGSGNKAYDGPTGSLNGCPSCNGQGWVYTNNSGGGGGTCFPGYTRVQPPSGLQNLSDLKKGDIVLSLDKQGVMSTQTILKKIKHLPTPIVTVITNNNSFDVTTVHAIKTKRGYLRVNQLKQGDTIYETSKSGQQIENCFIQVKNNGEVKPFYNLIISETYTFLPQGCIAHSFSYFRTTRVVIHSIYYIIKRIFSNQQNLANQL